MKEQKTEILQEIEQWVKKYGPFKLELNLQNGLSAQELMYDCDVRVIYLGKVNPVNKDPLTRLVKLDNFSSNSIKIIHTKIDKIVANQKKAELELALMRKNK